MGRHRHIISVRADGLATVLSSLVENRHVLAVTLVDTESGLTLDAYSKDDEFSDLEALGAAHADLAQTAKRLGAKPAATVLRTGDGRAHVVRDIIDPHGDRLALTAVVRDRGRAVVRAQSQLACVPDEALTAGPTLDRRPVGGRWLMDPPSPLSPAQTPPGLPGLEPPLTTAPPAASDVAPAPWATAMPPPTEAP